jgi:hypothetical protein
VWGKRAELASMYLKKGSEVFVHGRVERKEFTTSEGLQKSYEEVNASLIGLSDSSIGMLFDHIKEMRQCPTIGVSIKSRRRKRVEIINDEEIKKLLSYAKSYEPS